MYPMQPKNIKRVLANIYIYRNPKNTKIYLRQISTKPLQISQSFSRLYAFCIIRLGSVYLTWICSDFALWFWLKSFLAHLLCVLFQSIAFFYFTEFDIFGWRTCRRLLRKYCVFKKFFDQNEIDFAYEKNIHSNSLLNTWTQRWRVQKNSARPSLCCRDWV